MSIATKYFTGDFEFVALRSQLDCGPVPVHPTAADVQLAQCRMFGHEEATWEAAGAAYYLEKTKSRYSRDGADERAILSRVATRLADLALGRANERAPRSIT